MSGLIYHGHLMCEWFTSAPRIGIAYASKRDQKRKWRFTLKSDVS